MIGVERVPQQSSVRALYWADGASRGRLATLWAKVCGRWVQEMGKEVDRC